MTREASGPTLDAMRRAAGIDVGGTTIKGLRLDASGRRFPGPPPVPTPTDEAALVDAVAALARELGEPRVGVCVAGIVDETRGVALSGSNLPWRDSPLRTRLSDAIGAPVALGHDVRCGARAEARWGGHGGVRFLYVNLGTGVSAVTVTDGEPAPGPWHGEVGQPLVPDPADPTTLVSIERLASAEAVTRRYADRSGGPPPAGADVVFGRLAQGDPVAAAVVNEAVSALAQCLAFTVAATAPEVIVLAGGMAQAGSALVEPLSGRLESLLGILPRPRLVVSRLGPDAEAMGAAALALSAD